MTALISGGRLRSMMRRQIAEMMDAGLINVDRNIAGGLETKAIAQIRRRAQMIASPRIIGAIAAVNSEMIAARGRLERFRDFTGKLNK